MNGVLWIKTTHIGRCSVVLSVKLDDLTAFRAAALAWSSSIQLPLVTAYKTCESAQSSYYLTLQWIDDCSACCEAPGRVIGWGRRSGVWPPAPPPTPASDIQWGHSARWAGDRIWLGLLVVFEAQRGKIIWYSPEKSKLYRKVFKKWICVTKPHEKQFFRVLQRCC